MTTPPRSGEALTYITLVSLTAYAAIATDLYLPAIPYMIMDLGGTTSDGQLTLSVFMLGLALGQLVFGPLSDRFGRIPVVRAGTLLFLVTSILCALANDMGFIWAMRGLQGIAAASGPVIARAIVRDRYEGNRAAQVMSTLSAAMAIIPMVAPSIGALILEFADWPAVFIALAVFAGLVLVALSRLPETTSNSSGERLTLRTIIRSFSEMLRRHSFLGYQMAGSFSFSALFVYLSTVAFFLPDVFNIPTSLFGYAFALTVFGFMTGSLINARLVMRFGMNQTLKAGLSISLLSAVVIVFLSGKASDYLYAMAALSSTLFLGVGLTASNASMGAISLYAHRAGSASAVYGFTHALLASAVGAVAGLLYQGRLLEPAVMILGCAMLAFSGLWLVHWRSDR